MREMKDSGVEWIGEIPEEWDYFRIKYNFYLKGRIGWQGLKAEEFIDIGPYLITGTDFQNGRVSWETCYHISDERFIEAPEIHVTNDDLLITKDGTVGKVAYIEAVPDKASLNSHILLIRPKVNMVTNKYLFWVLQSPMFDIYNGLAQNGTIMASLSQEKISNFSFVIPDLYQQHRIADYLDAKCAQIDRAIARQQEIIERLKEYKLSVITEAVTKGLNPDVPMKDSGIEWIGEMPEHWVTFRIAALYYEVYEEGNDDLPILSVSINTGVSDRELDDEEQDRVFVRSDDKSKYKRVQIGDLTYNMMRAWQGAFGAVRVDGMVSPAYVVARPHKQEELDSRYIEYLLRTTAAKEEMRRNSHGIADFRLRLYWAYFKSMKICFPKKQEQEAIADYIDNKSGQIDSIIARKDDLISKLTEYKKSLIYEIVTGKREV